MLKYFIFIIYLAFSRFRFLSLPVHKKIKVLKHHKLYFQAGILCKKHHIYDDALYYFKKSHSPKHMIDCYIQLGDLENAIDLCKKYKFYQLGAQLCATHHFDYEAAYFNMFIDINSAISYYKYHHCWYELGICYLYQYNFYGAYDMFQKCTNPLQRLEGYHLVEEAAITLYLTHQYYEALRIFMYIEDYLSALECAKRLENADCIAYIAKLISQIFTAKEHYEAAIYYKTLASQHQFTTKVPPTTTTVPIPQPL